jgi:hypothetical protein
MSNQLTITVYSSGSTPIADPAQLLPRVEQIRFSTVYPGGIFADCSFFIPCNVTGFIPIQHAQRITIRNGLSTVWEGLITSLTLSVTADRQGLDIQATGYWGLAFRRYKYNRWIDRRFNSNIYGVWTGLISSSGGGSKVTFDQNEQLLIQPKAVEWSNGNTAYIEYRTNASSNVKRVKFAYQLGTTAEANPVRAKKYTSIGGTWTANLPNMIDGLASSTQTVSMATGDYLFIAIDDPASVTGFRFDFGGTVNANTAALTLEYYGIDAAWHALTITDGTSSAGKTWAQDGAVTFTAFDGWDMVAVNGSQKFFYARFSVSAGLTANVVINDIHVQRAQSWTLFLNDLDHSTTLWSTSTAGSGTQDITLTTSSTDIAFGITSNAQQKVVGTGIYGRITDLAVVAESWDGTAKTTVTDLLDDMVHYLSTPFADNYTHIAANSYDLLTTGFVEDALQKSLAEQMMTVGSFSATDDPYSVGVLEADALGSGNSSPAIYYEKVPDLTDYEYAVRIDEENLEGIELVLSSDFDTLFNRSFVTFTDVTGKQTWAFYVDYAAMDNDASKTKYLQRTTIVPGGVAATAALAGRLGAVVIKVKKDPAYYMRGPLNLKGSIRKKDGSLWPVSLIRAGERIKIENASTEAGDILGAGLIILITGTEYDDEAETNSVTASVSDELAAYLAAKHWPEAGPRA